MYVCMYVWSSRSADWVSTGMVANPACGPCPRSRSTKLSRETGSTVPSSVSAFILRTPRLNLSKIWRTKCISERSTVLTPLYRQGVKRSLGKRFHCVVILMPHTVFFRTSMTGRDENPNARDMNGTGGTGSVPT